MRRLSLLVEGLALVAALGLFIAQGLDSVLGRSLVAMASVLGLWWALRDCHASPSRREPHRR